MRYNYPAGLIALLFCVAVGCDGKTAKVAHDQISVDGSWGSGEKINVIEYDGCEYLAVYINAQGGGGWSITHKGNCKHCAERAVKIELERPGPTYPREK